MTYFIGEANSQTLNLEFILQRRSGGWSKDPRLFILWLLVHAAVQSKKSHFKLLYFCILTIIRKSKKPGKWKLPRDLRSMPAPHDYSVFKTWIQSSSALGLGWKGKRKTKQNWILNSCFLHVTTSCIWCVPYAICFYSVVYLLNQQQWFSCHPLTLWAYSKRDTTGIFIIVGNITHPI